MEENKHKTFYEIDPGPDGVSGRILKYETTSGARVAEYVVELPRACTCPASQFRKHAACKHVQMFSKALHPMLFTKKEARRITRMVLGELNSKTDSVSSVSIVGFKQVQDMIEEVHIRVILKENVPSFALKTTRDDLVFQLHFGQEKQQED